MKIARSGNHTCEKQSVLCQPPSCRHSGSHGETGRHAYSLLRTWLCSPITPRALDKASCVCVAGVPSPARENCCVKPLPQHTKMEVHLRQETIIKSAQRTFESQRANESSSLSLPCRHLSRELTEHILLLEDDMWWF